ncbi:MAG: hypothetical protein AB8E87_13655 [Prochlorococcus sp.]|nr:hypothetical protein [Prochlorococcaceae cyanobacterium Fu_MAG_50]
MDFGSAFATPSSAALLGVLVDDPKENNNNGDMHQGTNNDP